ncbi:MAG: hypothetical protein V3U60_15850 [Gammaproteobacteria bacterium]
MLRHVITVIGGLEIIGGAALTIWPALPIGVACGLMGVGLLTVIYGLWGIVEKHRKPAPEAEVPRWLQMWPFSVHFRDIFPFRRLIPLNEAARIAYERTQGTLAAAAAERPWAGTPDVVGYYATALAGQGDIPVYRFREHIPKLKQIPRNTLPTGSFKDNATTFTQHGKQSPLYRHLVIKRLDSKPRIKAIKSWDG